ncbi:glyoxalase superfamily protein [Flexivirga meconopsidis]|uniref:glyoxalase superfamily protein n=1 Tax=Flexivirga meconopsidis TaxID=2977121 RepID=UPI00223EAB4E|nr:glyoxalase superfamily protein [Flexivirga meconopsidis]
MDLKLEVVPMPVTDVDRAKAFYTDQLGFHADFDERPVEGIRFVQLTPPGSACSIVIGEGVVEMQPGTQQGVMFVIDDADAALSELTGKGVQTGPVDEQEWGRFLYVTDPDGNKLVLQQLPSYALKDDGSRKTVDERS